MTNADVLEQTLTRNESKIYMAMLELGQTTSGPLIKKTGIHSSKVYESIERLISKGLVSYIIKSGVKYFQPTNPERIIDFLEEKKETINQQESKISDILPDLLARFNKAKTKYTVEVFEGYEGLKSAFNDASKDYKKGDEYQVFGIPQVSEKAKRFFDLYHTKERMQRGIRVKAIFNKNAKERAEQYKKLALTEVKYMPTGVETPTSVNVFKEKTIIVIGVLEEPLAILITSKLVADSFRAQFELLWKIAKT